MISDKKWNISLRRSGQSIFNNSVSIDTFHDGYIALQELHGPATLILTEHGLILIKISNDLTQRIERNGTSKYGRY